MHPLADIAHRASVLIDFAPEAASNLHKAIEGMRLCQQHDDQIDLGQFLETERHKHDCYLDNCREAAGLMLELARLVYTHLPEVEPELIGSTPQWRFRDPATDWEAIVAELRRIKHAAARKALAKAPRKADPVLSLLEQALAMLVADPDRTDKEIAGAVGIHPKTMNKPTWKKYRDARAALRVNIPHGSKTDGVVEAYDE